MGGGEEVGVRSAFLKSDKLSSSPAFPIMSHSQDLTMSLGKMGYALRNQGTGKLKGSKKGMFGQWSP